MARISKGIVITTSNYTNAFLPELLQSIEETPYSIYVHTNTDEDNRWELGGIQAGKDNYDEFIHIMDTTLIKDISLFDKLFEMAGNVFLTEGGYHYMGKFVSDTLPEIPRISTKAEAIAQELHWYRGARTYFKPDLPVHTNVFVEKHGQKRMLLENEYMLKYKGTYSL